MAKLKVLYHSDGDYVLHSAYQKLKRKCEVIKKDNAQAWRANASFLQKSDIAEEKIVELERKLAEANKLLKAACDQLVIFKNDCDEADAKVAGLCEAIKELGDSIQWPSDLALWADKALKRFGEGK